jgi:hypothetical protein
VFLLAVAFGLRHPRAARQPSVYQLAYQRLFRQLAKSGTIIQDKPTSDGRGVRKVVTIPGGSVTLRTKGGQPYAVDVNAKRVSVTKGARAMIQLNRWQEDVVLAGLTTGSACGSSRILRGTPSQMPVRRT